MNRAFDYSAVECFDRKRFLFQIEKCFSARGLMTRGFAKQARARIPREMSEPIGKCVYLLCHAHYHSNIH